MQRNQTNTSLFSESGIKAQQIIIQHKTVRNSSIRIKETHNRNKSAQTLNSVPVKMAGEDETLLEQKMDVD